MSIIKNIYHNLIWTIFWYIKFEQYDNSFENINLILTDIIDYAYACKLKDLVFISNKYAIEEKNISILKDLNVNVLFSMDISIPDFILTYGILNNNNIPFYCVSCDDKLLKSRFLRRKELEPLYSIADMLCVSGKVSNKKVKSIFDNTYIKK